MSVRTRRLIADRQLVSQAFANHPRIRIREMIGEPPERYRIEYFLRGLAVQNGAIVEKYSHLIEVFLTLGYPRQAPQCRMLTPVFHPNIAPHAICIGDHWSAGESLAALIVRIGEMITFQSYNTKSPLNGLAARWADENAARLPIERVDLSLMFETPTVAPGATAAAAGGAPLLISPETLAAAATSAEPLRPPAAVPMSSREQR